MYLALKTLKFTM